MHLRLAASASVALLLVSCSEYEITKNDEAGAPYDTALGEEEVPDDDPGTTEDPPQEWTSELEGRICDPGGGDWIVGAYVYIPIDTNGDGVEDARIEGTTDADGHFLLTGIPDGTWTVYVEKGSFSTSFEVTLTGGRYEMPDPECLNPVDIAVVTGMYDDIGAILRRMGLTYTEYDGLWGSESTNFLKDLSAMEQYDIIFLNCGMSDLWIYTDKATVSNNLKEYVKRGGSVYASDWAYYAVEASFPDAATFYGNDNSSGSAYVGMVGEINGTVHDPDFQAALGSSTLKVAYDLDSWAVVESVSSSVDVLVSGNAQTWSGGTVSNSPLAIGFKPGGRMIYTSFHNEGGMSSDMEIILQQIILSL